jgi:hypothetical protein
MSNIWYSAEVAGTIIVQCIPILRPFLRDMHATFTSSKLHDTEDGKSTWRSTIDAKRTSAYTNSSSTRRNSASEDKKNVNVGVIPLGVIPENFTSSLVDIHHSDPEAEREQERSAKLIHGTWPFELEQHVRVDMEGNLDLRSPRSNRESGLARSSRSNRESDLGLSLRSNRESDLRSPRSDMWDYEEEEEMERRKGLSPPPPRVVRP